MTEIKSKNHSCFLSNLFKISEFLCDTGSTEVKPGFPHEDDCTIEYVTCSLTKPSEMYPEQEYFVFFSFISYIKSPLLDHFHILLKRIEIPSSSGFIKIHSSSEIIFQLFQ